MKQLRVALAHDFFVDYGGAERVVETLHEMFPEAPVYTSFVHQKALGMHWDRFKDWDIRQSWASKIPGITKLYSPLRVLAAKFFESFDFSDYDVVISSTNMYMAKAIRTHKPTVHICYCHTPPRSLYGYSTMMNWKKNMFVRVFGELINHYMRIVDFETSKNPDVFIANSKEVQSRIKKFYRRDSVVIYPPIEIPLKFEPIEKKEFYLYVGRIAASKHVDLAIHACNKAKKQLKVVGRGGNLEYLQSIAGETISFEGAVDDIQLHELYKEAKCVIYPAEDEDFGMIAVEAMAYGTPVIVHRSGGFLESVIEGETGEFFDQFSVEDVMKSIGRIEEKKCDQQKLHEYAKKFSKERFKQEMLQLLMPDDKQNSITDQ